MTDAKPLAVVTGASSGIGRELARQFATNGFDVIISAEDSELMPAADNLAATGAQIQPVRADRATFGGVEQLLRRGTRAPAAPADPGLACEARGPAAARPGTDRRPRRAAPHLLSSSWASKTRTSRMQQERRPGSRALYESRWPLVAKSRRYHQCSCDITAGAVPAVPGDGAWPRA